MKVKPHVNKNVVVILLSCIIYDFVYSSVRIETIEVLVYLHFEAQGNVGRIEYFTVLL